jgi:hypothetical protein
MIANWIAGCLLLSPESDEDEQALRALAEACPPMRWRRGLSTDEVTTGTRSGLADRPIFAERSLR